MGLIAYNIFIGCYSLGVRLASLWNPKAKLWIAGRKNIFADINSKLPASGAKIIWMHCASLGEFEQGRPLLESIRQQYPGLKIVLTFFSASGYEVSKDYKGVDAIFYLPMDSPANAKKFIDTINPALVLWVKYEYWYYYLSELKKRDIPTLLVSGIFRKGQVFFKSYGGFWTKMLGNFTHFFVQNENSKKMLGQIGVTQNITISGDTRFDRVIEIATQQLDAPIVKAFCQNQTVIVAGSTWEDDEMILAAYADETNHREKIILVPHELDKGHLDTVKKVFKKSVRYSEIESNPSLMENIGDYNTLIIDKMGMLSRLYNYGDINYIGGGFTRLGIHNILEAAVWGKPIIIGENYENYFEAVDLVDCLAAESISDTNELKEAITILLSDKKAYNESGKAARDYVFTHGGATKKITDYIQVNRLLIN